jgi:small subunit ribosomal protein S6e
MAFKVVISDPKSGKSYQTELEQSGLLAGKAIGDKIDGGTFNLPGYELEVTGGSDKVGNPMRKDVEGAAARRILLTGGAGFKPTRKGERRKKRVLGRRISNDIVQVNLKVVKAGTAPLDKVLAKAEPAAEEAPKEEAKPEEKKEEEPKPEEKPEEAPAEEKPEEAPAEEPKEEEKKEEAPAEEKPAEEPKEEKKEE